MKKTVLFVALALLSVSVISAKSKANAIVPDTYDYDLLVTSIKGVQAPVVSDDYIVFTADYNARSVGIAFDFENYKVIHHYSVRRIFDYEGEQTNAWYFYALPKPKKLTKISYKLIIDGLWTTDPTNINTEYDWENGILLSYVDIPQTQDVITQTADEGITKFICNAAPGQKIRLGGTFTNWDSWVYEMTEVSPGKYEICLPLPAGTYYYAYFSGLKRFIDDSNPEKAYSSDGKIVSKIVIN